MSITKMSGTRLGRQAGLTLIEMMVAMVVSMVVSAIAATVFVSARQSARYAEGLARYQETLRFAQAAIAEDLRTSGQLGCRVDLTTATGLKENDGVAYGMAVEGKDAWDTNSTTLGAIGKLDAKAGSDAIRLQFASRDGNPLAADMAAAGDDLTVSTAANYSVADTLIVSDCEKADTFKPSAAVTNNTTITHVAFSGAYKKSVAQVYHFLDRAYYISATNNLMQMTGNTKLPIANGIEELSFDYGLDVTADGYPDRYVDASQVAAAAWKDVVAVRVCMLVASQDQGLTVLDKYTNCAGNSIDNADHRLRFPIHFTVRIRNRGVL